MSGAGLTAGEIIQVVNRYIGVAGGYLGDFSYRSHADFYPEYCDLDIDPYQYEGTTRERFIAILKGSPPETQARILQGVLERFPLDAQDAPTTRTQELQDRIGEMILRIEGAASVPSPSPKVTTEVVSRAIADAEVLLRADGPTSGVDRIHTALHGYLCAQCDVAGIPYSREDSLARLLKLLRQQHPALQDLGPRQQDTERVLQSLATTMDALNPIRNKASMAHPNEALLEGEEALLVINAARTIIQYLDAKLAG